MIERGVAGRSASTIWRWLPAQASRHAMSSSMSVTAPWPTWPPGTSIMQTCSTGSSRPPGIEPLGRLVEQVMSAGSPTPPRVGPDDTDPHGVVRLTGRVRGCARSPRSSRHDGGGDSLKSHLPTTPCRPPPICSSLYITICQTHVRNGTWGAPCNSSPPRDWHTAPIGRGPCCALQRHRETHNARAAGERRQHHGTQRLQHDAPPN